MTKLPKLWIGTMSQRVIDSVIKVNNEITQPMIGLLPTRRQIDFCGGYVSGGMTTEELVKYVRTNSKHTLIERDHSGEKQGKDKEGIHDWLLSLNEDVKLGLDIIHYDPFKAHGSLGFKKTAEMLDSILTGNKIEIGTEQAIFPYSTQEFKVELLDKIKSSHQIGYVVVQGGTALKAGINTGQQDNRKLKAFIELVQEYGLKSKEHNGDYLTDEQISSKFKLGLDAINIAPELGTRETDILVKYFTKKQMTVLKELCLTSTKIKRWFGDKRLTVGIDELVSVLGHYYWQTFDISKEAKEEVIDNHVKFLKHKLEVING